MYGTVLAAMLPFGSQVAEARGGAHHWRYGFHYSGWHSVWHASRAHTRYARHYGGYHRYYASYPHYHYGGGRIQCVAFVREVTGVQLSGNAAGWWHAADGLYDRGNKPQPGAVLVFRGAGRMRLGHVAVVRAVRSSREIDIDHAHWAGGGIYRDVSVIDVSPSNDWTAVRVAIRAGETYGSVYPTYGFIYDRVPAPLIQTAQETDTTVARVQKASATELPESLDTEDAPRSGIRHWRRHWRRLVARRRVIAEVAEQPALTTP